MRTAVSAARIAPEAPGLRLWTDADTFHLAGDCPQLANAISRDDGEPGRTSLGDVAVAGSHQPCVRCCSPYADEQLRDAIGPNEAYHHTWITLVSATVSSYGAAAGAGGDTADERGEYHRLTAALFDYDRLPAIDPGSLQAMAAATLRTQVEKLLADRTHACPLAGSPAEGERQWMVIVFGLLTGETNLPVWENTDLAASGPGGLVACRCPREIVGQLERTTPGIALSPTLPADLTADEMETLLCLGITDADPGDQALLVAGLRAASL